MESLLGLCKMGTLIAIFISTSAASQYYGGETPCSTSLGSTCYTVINNKSIDNIVFFFQSPNYRVDFRNKEKPLKNIYYSGTEAEAKGILSILLAAKASGANVKIYISAGNYNDNSNVPFLQATLVDP
jgi:hypothetical protein